MTSVRWSLAVLALVVASATPAAAQQPSPAGRVKTVSGSAFIVRDQSVDSGAARASRLRGRQRCGPDADGTIGVTLKDDTRLSLGPESEVRLERFVYAPGDGGSGWC